MRRSAPSLLAPPTSIVTTSERTFVIRVRDGRAEYVDVTRGAPGTTWWKSSAPSAGDEIVRRGTDEIRQGSQVSVRSAPGTKR